MSRTRTFWILVGIAIIGIALRSFNLTGRSLWFDESFSWRLIQFPFMEMIARDGADVHPPLYYIFLRGWAYVFGSSLLSIRAFSVACAGLATFVAYLFTAYAFRSRRAGVYAATFLALSPWAISYGWEGRMYPLGILFALFSSYALLHGVRDKSFTWFGVYGVTACALMYTHYYGIFTIAAHVLFVIGSLVQSTRWRVGEMVQSRIFWAGLFSTGIAILLFAPWLPTFMQQRAQVQEVFWIPPVTRLAVLDTFYHIFAPTLSIPREYGVSRIPVILVALVCVYSVLRYRKMDGMNLTLLLGLIPILSGLLISLGGRSLYNDRYFAFTGIFLFILVAYVISDIKNVLVRRLVFSAASMLLLVSFASYWNQLDIAHKGGAHSAASHVFTKRAANDAVLVSSPFVYFSILHYADEEFNAGEVPHLYSTTGELIHFAGGPILTHEDVAGPEDVASYTGTVWVVDTTGFGEKPFAAPHNWKEISTQTYPEVFAHQGDIIVREFQVHL